MKSVLIACTVAVIATLVLFDVEVNPRFRLPGAETRLDPGQEARFEACVKASEEAFHERTFAEVDNPDVQRELLYRQSQEAKSSCREAIPERTIEVEVPLDVNLIDLTWRY